MRFYRGRHESGRRIIVIMNTKITTHPRPSMLRQPFRKPQYPGKATSGPSTTRPGESPIRIDSL